SRDFKTERGREARSSSGVSPRRAEAESVVAVRRPDPEAKGRARTHRVVDERAATRGTAFICFHTRHIFFLFYRLFSFRGGIIAINILAPLPGVAVQVEQAQVVRLARAAGVADVPRIDEIPR